MQRTEFTELKFRLENLKKAIIFYEVNQDAREVIHQTEVLIKELESLLEYVKE